MTKQYEIGLNSASEPRTCEHRQGVATTMKALWKTRWKKSQLTTKPVVEPQVTGTIRNLHKHDVLCGRGGRINSHEGNISFRAMCAELKVEYTSFYTKKAQKAQLAYGVVERIRGLDPPGRFLKLDSTTGLWYDIGCEAAVKKVGQAIRESSPAINPQKKSMAGSKEEVPTNTILIEVPSNNPVTPLSLFDGELYPGYKVPDDLMHCSSGDRGAEEETLSSLQTDVTSQTASGSPSSALPQEQSHGCTLSMTDLPCVSNHSQQDKGLEPLEFHRVSKHTQRPDLATSLEPIHIVSDRSLLATDDQDCQTTTANRRNTNAMSTNSGMSALLRQSFLSDMSDIDYFALACSVTSSGGNATMANRRGNATAGDDLMQTSTNTKPDSDHLEMLKSSIMSIDHPFAEEDGKRMTNDDVGGFMMRKQSVLSSVHSFESDSVASWAD